MKTTNEKKILTFGILALVLIAGIAIYKFGSDIPLVNKIPIFSGQHEHEYRPVLDEKGDVDYWTCAMHPSVRLKEPGKCPICGMETIAVRKTDSSNDDKNTQANVTETTKDKESAAGMQGHDHSTMGVPTKKDKGGESKSTFTVSPERQQLIGVKTQPALVRHMDKEIRTVGVVAIDETKIYNVQTKVSGWIDEVFVDFTWQHVNIGDPLFSLYSPQLVSTQQEYLLALKSKNILGNNEFIDIASASNSLLEATRRRLELWDISNNQIDELAKTQEVKESLIFYSPVQGHVSIKNVFENMYVEPNTTLYKIADHTTAWVQVDIYESELPLVKLGQGARMTLASYPGEAFDGNVTFIWPHLDPKTRTAKVRLEFPNPDLKLLPEMYANVEIMIPLGEHLSIPKSSVLRTGKQDIVFIDKGNGEIEMRRVELGQKAGGYYEVLRGLNEGEYVVYRANFLIDSESKVQAAVAAWDDESEEENETIQKLELYPEQEMDGSSESMPGQENIN